MKPGNPILRKWFRFCRARRPGAPYGCKIDSPGMKPKARSPRSPAVPYSGGPENGSPPHPRSSVCFFSCSISSIFFRFLFCSILCFCFIRIKKEKPAVPGGKRASSLPKRGNAFAQMGKCISEKAEMARGQDGPSRKKRPHGSRKLHGAAKGTIYSMLMI